MPPNQPFKGQTTSISVCVLNPDSTRNVTATIWLLGLIAAIAHLVACISTGCTTVCSRRGSLLWGDYAGRLFLAEANRSRVNLHRAD